MKRLAGVGSLSIGVRRSLASALKPGECVETAVSRFGRSLRILTTSVSLGVAPSMWNGPTSPGHAPPAPSYQSPHSELVSTMSPGLMRKTGSRLAKVGYPIFGVKRCVSVITPKVESDIKTSVSATEQHRRNQSFKRMLSLLSLRRRRKGNDGKIFSCPA